MQPEEVIHTVNLLQTSPEQFSSDTCQEYIVDTTTNQAYPVNWSEEGGGYRRSGLPTTPQQQGQPQRQGWNNQQHNHPQKQLWQSNQSQGQPRPSHILVRSGGPNQQFPNKKQQTSQAQQYQPVQQGQQSSQQRPIVCWRCNSPDHFIKACPHPSRAQTCLKEAQAQLDLRNFEQAFDKCHAACFLHDKEPNTYDKLSSSDLIQLEAVDLALKRYYQNEKIQPTPVAPKEMILVSQHCSTDTIPIQQISTQHPDLMSFDEVAANNNNIGKKDFQSGV